jgi:hypothetical protein
MFVGRQADFVRRSSIFEMQQFIHKTVANRARSCGAEKFSFGPSGTMRVGLIAVMLM